MVEISNTASNKEEGRKEDVRAWLTEKVRWYNSSQGNLKGYNCTKCKNRGDYCYINNEGYEMYRDCECMQVRRNIANANASGYGDTLKGKTFENFNTESEWQKSILTKAKQFTFSKSKWFAILGQSGIGKTHICATIARELLLKGMSVRLMKWVEDSNKLKARVNTPTEYDALFDTFKDVEVLVVDDLFKNEPTQADIRLAFELLDYRYVRCKSGYNAITIINSEKLFDELTRIDGAIAGRIKEMTGNYLIKVSGKEKDIRLTSNFNN